MEAESPGYWNDALVIRNRLQQPLVSSKFVRIPRSQDDRYTREDDSRNNATARTNNGATSLNEQSDNKIKNSEAYSNSGSKGSGYKNESWRCAQRVKQMQQSVFYCTEMILKLVWIIVYCMVVLISSGILFFSSASNKETKEISNDKSSTSEPSPEQNSKEDSLIIVEEKKVNGYNFNRTPSKVNGSRKQYGTSLSTNWRPRYLGFSRTATPRALLTDLFNSRVEDASALNLLEGGFNKVSNDYENYVSRFYLPRAPLSKYKYSLVDSLIENFVPEEKTTFDFFPKTIQERIARERETLESKVTPLTSKQFEKVSKCWSLPLSTIVVSSFQIDISVRDLLTLREGHWLNDNILDFYFNLITVANSTVFCWTTHFFTTLKLRGYQGVARWAKRRKVNLTEKKLIFVPINILSTHWALAVVDNVSESFQYYDSLSSGGNILALRIIRTYMIEEGKKQNSSVNYETFEMNQNMPSPQQGNGSDCGVFTCISAKYLSRNKELAYGQKDTKVLRQKMAYEIITKQLM